MGFYRPDLTLPYLMVLFLRSDSQCSTVQSSRTSKWIFFLICTLIKWKKTHFDVLGFDLTIIFKLKCRFFISKHLICLYASMQISNDVCLLFVSLSYFPSVVIVIVKSGIFGYRWKQRPMQRWWLGWHQLPTPSVSQWSSLHQIPIHPQVVNQC